MFIVTNRQLDKRKSGLGVFTARPNQDGPNELRLIQLTTKAGKHHCKVLADKLKPQTVKKLSESHALNLDLKDDWYASLEVACELMSRAHKEKKHILFYVHGYNNDLEDVVNTAKRLESLYNVIVVPFTWPANGGGVVTGTAAYLRDKADARASSDALAQFVDKIRMYHLLLTEARTEKLLGIAKKKFPNNPQAQRELLSELQDKECQVTLNLLCHSMGNYVLKYASKPSGSPFRKLTFDNVCLVAADTNNKAHREWAEALEVRNRLYVVINERDYALKWSRRKPGSEQLARLGHYLRDLTAPNAYYINVTGANDVETSHSYFADKAVGSTTSPLRQIFKRLFEGTSAEDLLQYRSDINAYEIRG